MPPMRAAMAWAERARATTLASMPRSSKKGTRKMASVPMPSIRSPSDATSSQKARLDRLLARPRALPRADESRRLCQDLRRRQRLGVGLLAVRQQAHVLRLAPDDDQGDEDDDEGAAEAEDS